MQKANKIQRRRCSLAPHSERHTQPRRRFGNVRHTQVVDTTMSQSILLTSGTLPFRLSSPCRPRSRRSGTRVGVARQPPGDRDPSFSKPLPSFRLQPVNDKEEEEEDHLTRTHHPMTACSFFAPSLSLLGKGALFRLGAAVEASGDLKKALIITESRGIRHIVEAVSRELFSAVR